MRSTLLDVFPHIAHGRGAQAARFGPAHLEGSPAPRRLNLLTEEFPEVARAVNDHQPPEELAHELTQLATPCVAWLEVLP